MRLKKKIDFSIIMPTRNRLSFIQRCMSSFYDKAKNPEKIEFIILVDFDDPIMRDIDKFWKPEYNGHLVFCHQATRMIEDYNNYGAQCSVGKYLWISNDDYEMTTQNWDEIIREGIEKFVEDKADRICYVQVDDSTHTNWNVAYHVGCCCPVLTWEAVDLMNGIMPKEINMWGADIALWNIFAKLPKNRVLDLIKDIKVLHHCRHNRSTGIDSISERVERVSVKHHLEADQEKRYIDLISGALK